MPTTLLSPGAGELLLHSRRADPVFDASLVRLDSGDPDFDTPEHVARAMGEALARGLTHYGPPQGDPALREVLAEDASARSGATYTARDVVVTHGANAALASAFLATVGRGDRVIIPEPTYSLYVDLVRFAGGVPVLVPQRAPHFHLDIEAIAAAAAGAKLLVLCNPCNPTGAVYPADQLAQVEEIVERNGLLLVSDEAYDGILFDEVRFTSALELERILDRVVYVQTFSKTYAMTGWRIGYLVARNDLAQACARVHRTLNGPVNLAIQQAALAARTATPDEWRRRVTHEYERRRTLVKTLLTDAGVGDVRLPEGTFYALVGHAPEITSLELTRQAMSAGVSVRAGSEFGPSGEGVLRLTFAAGGEALREGLRRLAGAVLSVEQRVA